MTKRYSIALTISLALMAASIIAIAASAHGSNQPPITGTNWFPAGSLPQRFIADLGGFA